jgi:peptidoglycan/xylan/chitin deacetylase (PgdA/CDA1 family)
MKRLRQVRWALLFHRVLHIVLVAAIGALLFSGARWLYQHNYTNHKVWEDVALHYKYRYDFQRYTGASNKHAIKEALLPTKEHLPPATPQARASSVPVLLYHRIANDPNPYNVPTAVFKDQMFALKRAGWHTVSMSDYVAFTRGTKKLPAKSFLLTFDDGTKDSYYPVQPILTALNFRATNFIITRYSIDQPIGSRYYLSVNEIKQMQASGRWDIEAHTHDGHTYYPVDAKGTKGTFYPNKLYVKSKHRMETDQEYATRVLTDMQTAKSAVQKTTNHPVTAIAFPFGDVGEDRDSNYQASTDILKKDVAQTFDIGLLQYFPGRGTSQSYAGGHNTYEYRIEVPGNWDGARLTSFVTRGQAKQLPYVDGLKANHGWLSSYGTVQVQDGALTLRSTPKTTGASAVLDGTKGWRNYTFTANMELQKGTSFSIFARNQGGPFQVGCNFSNNYLAIYTENGDDYHPIADDNFFLPVGQNLNVGIRVEGNKVQCLTNGVVLDEVYDVSMPLTGGVGVSTWSPNKPALLRVTNVTVAPAGK